MYMSKVVVPKNVYSNVCSLAFLFLPLPVRRELVSYLPPDCVQTKPWNPEDAWINKWTHRNIYMHLETYLKDPLATLLQHECSFFLLISLHQVFQGTVRQEDSLGEEERTWCWDFSFGPASCWPGWSRTERDNVWHPKWRWQWPHWPLLHPVLFSALSITFEGDINTQECTQVAGDGGGNGRQVGQDAEKLWSPCLWLQIPSCYCELNCTWKLFVFSVLWWTK